jgi:non-homologous end joining protein Ku
VKTPAPAEREEARSGKVVDFMAVLKRSLEQNKRTPPKKAPARKKQARRKTPARRRKRA